MKLLNISLVLLMGCNQVFGLEAPLDEDEDDALLDASNLDAGNIDARIVDGPFEFDAVSDAAGCSGLIIAATPQTWTDAVASCMAENARLAVVLDATQNARIRAAATGTLHLGLHRQAGNFVWVDGNSLGYVNWASGQPSNETGEDCVQMGVDGSWYDVDCTGTALFVCECL